MKKIDTHGLKIVGLEEASKSTENYGRAQTAPSWPPWTS